MSNYFCPKCNEPIVDIPGGSPNHTCTYITYSTRHNITDTDLAGLLDYLERVMGWEIGSKLTMHYMEYCHRKDDYMRIAVWSSGMIRIYGRLGKPLCECENNLFFRTYRTLLPVIRDLYSK